MQANQILPAGHPSIGAQRAVFLFVIGQNNHLLSVEATNEWAILCLERLLLVDGRVSDACEVLQVVRGHASVGMRSERADEVPFADFMTDIVDPGRVTADSVVSMAFGRALSPEENERIQQKLELARNTVEDVFEGFDAPVSETVEEESDAPESGDTAQPDRLTSALVNLGFKKPEVRRVVAALGDRVLTDDLHSLIREGLRQLAA